jgi:hypothetical protein
MILAGALTVWHYTSTNELTIPAGKGALMGLTAAALGAFAAIFLNFLLIKMGIRADRAIVEAIISMFGDNLPPDQVDTMQDELDQPVRFGKHFLNGLIGVVVGAIFGAIGGVIGAAMFKRGPVASEGGTV